ncbi:Floral homeotic protein isoform 4 [Theobroma cacao]|uniref:Floral homeotic protein isoform 4 n=1 Tax=Theobroma cacao TaxID=3641 RepID=A0A061FBQ0_THECC|nr:Floral homeotic protein isoform 4 [Theobroma cacao]
MDTRLDTRAHHLPPLSPPLSSVIWTPRPRLIRICFTTSSPGLQVPTSLPPPGPSNAPLKVPLATTSESLPERAGEPDCPYFLKTQRCKFGSKCKFNHPKDKLAISGAFENIQVAVLPERPSEPSCSFYVKTGKCKFGATCKFHHPKDIQIASSGQDNARGEQPEIVTKTGGATADVKPALFHNSKGLPIRPDEVDCPFYLKTGSCKYGSSCRYNHPDRNAFNPPAAVLGHSLVASASNLNIGVVTPAASIYQTIDPRLGQSTLLAQPTFPTLGVAPTVYPQRPGQTECEYYMKTGDCKFGDRCKFHHPIDRSVSKTKQTSEQAVKLTLAGLPRREVIDSWDYNEGRCSLSILHEDWNMQVWCNMQI